MPGEDQNKTHCEATAQAADVLAILYLARGDYPSAKRAVDDGLKIFAGYQPMKTAYIEKLLRNRLAARASEAQKLYEAAEKLRNSKKYLEAGRLYVQLLTTYPKDPISHAANFRMGECLVGLEGPAQALELGEVPEGHARRALARPGPCGQRRPAPGAARPGRVNRAHPPGRRGPRQSGNSPLACTRERGRG